MARAVTKPVDWTRWLARWDAQQQGYLPRREVRFEIMLDALAALLPPDPLCLDLGSGPGSLSSRLLTRLPRARVIAIDFDPVLLAIGRGALGDAGGRLSWLELDLRTADLRQELRAEHIDAVLTTTALHWLPTPRLRELYAQLGALLPRHGVFLNGDNIPFGSERCAFVQLAREQRTREEEAAFGAGRVEDWNQFWHALADEEQLAPLLSERTRRHAAWPRDHAEPALAVHEEALRAAGFHEVGTIWQHLDDRVLLALR